MRQLALVAVLGWLASSTLAIAQDPEASADGRTEFLGREIAQTMHWTGAAWLLRATREEEENGAALRRWLAVPAGHRVADLGCGNGYHTLPLAREVGPSGKVFAVELQRPYLVTGETAGCGDRCEAAFAHAHHTGAPSTDP